ncbi:hypothetical protein ACQ4LE_007168 [Meloidogyne hapla]
MSAWKAYKALLTKRENLQKAMQDPRVKTTIRAQMASPAPPLGPALGQRGVNVGNFCKEFNTVTENIKNATILPVTVHVRPDRTYEIEIETPTTKWLLMQAAGIRKEKQEDDEITGKLSVKHIYEIAKIKSTDKAMIGVPIKVFNLKFFFGMKCPFLNCFKRKFAKWSLNAPLKLELKCSMRTWTQMNTNNFWICAVKLLNNNWKKLQNKKQRNF